MCQPTTEQKNLYYGALWDMLALNSKLRTLHTMGVSVPLELIGGDPRRLQVTTSGACLDIPVPPEAP